MKTFNIVLAAGVALLLSATLLSTVVPVPGLITYGFVSICALVVVLIDSVIEKNE